MFRRLSLGILLVCGLLGALPPQAQVTAIGLSAVNAPTLKWAYGGCAPSDCESGWYSSPAVADLDNDSQPDVIWGSRDVVALNGSSGALKWRGDSSGRVWPGVAVADLTGDGTLEVIVGREGDLLTVYNNQGGVVWTRNPFGGDSEIRTLAVEDLETDGQLEIIVGRADDGRDNERTIKQVSVYEPDGSIRPGWPARREEDEPIGYGANMYNENITVADLNNDGFKEVIAPTDVHYITALDRGGNQLPAHPMYGAGEVWSQVGVHVLQEIDLQGFADCDEDPSIPIGRKLRPNFANSAPAIADMDGDGTREIIVAGDVYNCADGDPNGDMYHMPWILKLDRTRWSGSGFDWTEIPPDPGTRPLSQNYNVIQNSVTNVVPADLDGDGVKEILFPSYDGRLHAYWLDKTQHGSWPFVVPGSGIRFASEPAVVDLDNDGASEVIFTSWPENGGNRVGQLHILSSLGVQLHAIDLPAPRGDDWNGGLGAPTVANIDSDPDLEIVVGTSASGAVAYDVAGSASAQIHWGTGRGSNKRTGVAAAEEGFSLRASPIAQNTIAGGSANYTITLGGAFTNPVNLSATVDPAGPTVALSQPSQSPPGTVTLTVTDTHPAGPLLPGAFYTIQITGSGGSFTRTATVYLLVGGEDAYLPVVVR